MPCNVTLTCWDTSSITTCSNDGICKDVRLSLERPLPQGFSSSFALVAMGSGKYAITATVGGKKQCIKPQLCGSRAAMYECSGILSWGSKDAWRIIDASTTSGGTKLYNIVSDECTSETLSAWLPSTTNAKGCELAFPDDPAGGACQPNDATGQCDKIIGSPVFDLWEIQGVDGSIADFVTFSGAASTANRNGGATALLSLGAVLSVAVLTEIREIQLLRQTNQFREI
ncbi:unnamed protein product [Polarella glacialis]|uniref:Uncharacterized protein n=1 Tax=Polarella glacialis TaxID=89957 RepID=A0A813LRF1_POLGL|nr:unnamed protein product [Polarella glacialis]CAE8733068.1 unnamed protein product [Polarella glacialis]